MNTKVLQGQIQRLSELRHISTQGLEKAFKGGFLRFGAYYGHDAWLITDVTNENSQARRMDGQGWEHLNGAKAYTLPKSKASHPIGWQESESFEKIAWVEGTPDFLAAHHFIYARNDIAIVAMLGAGHYIPPKILHVFTGKRIRIFPHLDEAGKKGCIRWAQQLTTVKAMVDAFSFEGLRQIVWKGQEWSSKDGEPIKDLNDCTMLHPACFEAEKELWGLL